ncbi:Pentatricopeptide repeat-containing protein [Apostasia shenzhenica]|uniref:Pentatricopeptide repeat-containing protein n=1 Tax=Apostasia shenzhenica TaxID=1088818 RepID=A0A2I0AH23_9ASPA|nr:Pentatricopeptide repeat-containing protein [Apostasia shenzhenica]
MRAALLFGIRSRLKSSPIYHLLSPSAGLCNNRYTSDDECSLDHQETLLFGEISDEALLGLPLPANAEDEEEKQDSHSPRTRFFEKMKLEADQIIHILLQDGHGFNSRAALNDLQVKVSPALVREVLLQILTSINGANKQRFARLAYKFFAWAGHQQDYKHTANGYNLTMKIFAESEELKAMWRLLDEMNQNGLPVTPRTFNILICTCEEAGMARKLVERFIKSQAFNYRPYKHSFNAILHSLINMSHYRLIEWVYQQMLIDGFQPDVFTYNVVLCAKYRLGKLDQFHRLLDEMRDKGMIPDLHTYNLMLHVLGKGDKPLAAVELLNYMTNVGCPPSVLHFTNLIDGLGRAGNMDACKYFFDEMMKKGCEPDVVSYTVIITGYIIAGVFEMAQELFNEMVRRGILPNVFTYNSMIRGLCIVGRFNDACSMLKEMENKGCTPNFSVYCTLVRRMRKAGKVSEANDIISYMVERGHYIHLLSRFMGFVTQIKMGKEAVLSLVGIKKVLRIRSSPPSVNVDGQWSYMLFYNQDLCLGFRLRATTLKGFATNFTIVVPFDVQVEGTSMGAQPKQSTYNDSESHCSLGSNS